jgi:hypothetical protein
MFATLRDHAMSGMMVLLRKRVECSAKIAMPVLPRGFPAMGLLLKRDLPRRIFLGRW